MRCSKSVHINNIDPNKFIFYFLMLVLHVLFLAFLLLLLILSETKTVTRILLTRFPEAPILRNFCAIQHNVVTIRKYYLDEIVATVFWRNRD